MGRRGGLAAGRLVKLLCSVFLTVTVCSAQTQCNTADEFFDPAKNYEYVYNGTVEVRHTAGERTATAGFSFSCVAIINGEQPCYHSLKLSTCSLYDRTSHPDHAARQHSFNRLLKRGHIHFRLAGGDVDQMFADPEEAPFITNVRRGVVNTLRISRSMLDGTSKSMDDRCGRFVERLSPGRHRVEWSRDCDPAENVPSVQSPFSLLPSLGLLEHRMYVGSTCDYITDSTLREAMCRQTWVFDQPTKDDFQVFSTQELRLLSTRDADPPLPQNSQQVSAGFVFRDADPFIDTDGSSVFERLRELISVSVPLMTPETPEKFTNLLRALRRKFESPLEMSSTCTNCTKFEKAAMDELARTAVLQCGSAACLRQVADMVSSGQLTGARLTPLYITWHWTPIHDADSAQSMYSLCELAPTRWCLLGLAAALRRNAAGPAGSQLGPVADKLRSTASRMVGQGCGGSDADVIMGLKTLRNMGELAFSESSTLDLVRSCLNADKPVMVTSEAVRTLTAAASLPPDFANVYQDVFQDAEQAMLTRQLAYLALLRQFPSERSFGAALQWAADAGSDDLAGFILRHWKHFPLTAPHRELTRRVAAARGVDLDTVPDALFNSVTESSLREFRLGQWLQMALPAVAAPEAGVQLYRLHGASYLPHALLLNTTLRLGAELTPVELELRAVGMERLVHDLVRDPEFDPTTVRGALRELATVLLGAYGGQYGGRSFTASLDESGAPDALRLSPAVSGWLRRVLESYQARGELPDDRPSAVLTVSVLGSQVAYVTAEEILQRLATPDPQAQPINLLGEKLFHHHTVFKFLESQHRVPLAVGLPLEIFADGTLAAGAAAEISSRLGKSYRNMREAFNGDAQLSASAGASLVVGLEVALPPFARAGLQLNSTIYTPFSLNVSYEILNRTIRLTAPKPVRKRTLLLLSHGAQLRQGGEVRPSPSAESRTSHCLPQAVYTGLTVCRELRHSRRIGFLAPVSYHITAENTDPIDTYTLDVWTSSREDGYPHGSSAHLFLHKPAAAAAELRLNIGFRLKPTNYSPLLFNQGQKANTTAELVVGDPENPTWRVYALRAQTERGNELYSETRGWLMNGETTLFSGELESLKTLPWVRTGTVRDELMVRLVRAGSRIEYDRRYSAARQAAGDVDFTADLMYKTAFRNSLVERLLAPQLFDTENRTAWLQLAYRRRLSANDELTELNWSHTARAATAGVTLAGLLNLTSTADSSARLVANLTSSETVSGNTLMYTAATGDFTREREGAAVTDRVRATLSYPGAEYEGRTRVDRSGAGLLTLNASLARAGDRLGRLTAALEPAAADGRRLTASLRLPSDEEVRLTSEFSAPPRPRPWLPWYRDDYTFRQSSRLTWPARDLDLASNLDAVRTADALFVSADMSLSRPEVSSSVSISWDKPRQLWNSDVTFTSPALRFNSAVNSKELSSGNGMERTFNQSSSSPMWDVLNHDVQGSVRTSCDLNCTAGGQRDLDLKLEHKWLRLRTSSSRYLETGGIPADMKKLDVTLDRTAPFLPSMTCSLKPKGDFTMALTLPAPGPPPKLDIRYSIKPPSRWQKVFIRSLEVDISDGPRARPTPALYTAVETTPGDPSRLSAELEVQPSAFLMAAQAVAGRAQMAVQEVRRALMDPQHPVNTILRPLTRASTVVDWVSMLPARVHAASSWVVGRVAALLSPWSSITQPLYQTARNVWETASSYAKQSTAELRQRANELYRQRAEQVARGPSLKERVLGLLPPALMHHLMQKVNQLTATALQRLPFNVQRTSRGSRTRIELTELPPYANVQTIWNISSLVRARLQQPSVVSEMLARPDDRRPLAALWRDGRSLALDGRSFVLPAVDGCTHLLLADVEQQGFSVFRSARQTIITFLDMNVLVNDDGQWHMDVFNVTLPPKLHTRVQPQSGRLVLRSSFGLQAELDLACDVVLFRLDPWMAPRTAGLLATAADESGWSLTEAWSRFGLESGGRCPSVDASAGPVLDMDGCRRQQTPQCSRLTGLVQAARQHRPLCIAPEPVRWQESVCDSGAVSGPVQVLLAVADPAVSAETVRLLAAAVHSQLARLGQRTVQYALVRDAHAATRPSWVSSPDELQLEGSKIRSDDLVTTLHRVMTERPFPGDVAHRVLVLFAPSDQLRGGASLTGLRRQLWSRRVAVHLVTPLAKYPLLETPVYGLSGDGGAITADARIQMMLRPHQGDLGQLVTATSGAAWDSDLLLKQGATTRALIADFIWQHVARAEPGPPLPGALAAGHEAQTAPPPGAAPRLSALSLPALVLLCLLPRRLL